ncbi:MAG: hypothetical protein JNK04_07890 [Myxococcales bacterium]|nr:hypothetical protein [Myxococcales bacterium]
MPGASPNLQPPVGRLRSYALMALGALAAGVLGAVFDQLTVSLSPEYFTLGKGASADVPLRLSAAAIGFRGGLPIGALFAGGLLWLRRRGARVHLLPQLARAAAAAMLSCLVCAMGMVAIDPFGVRPDASGVLTPSGATRFLACWGIHIGAYVGPMLSLGAAVRRAAASPT